MRAPLLSVFILFLVTGYAQITDGVNEQSFFDFHISMQKQKELNIITVSKNQQIVFSDTVTTNTKTCTGFSCPALQPFKDYFIFTKRERKNGRAYILSKTGDWKIIPGGSFWAAAKHQMLFILAERDNTNLLVFDLKNMKTVLEKFNCDEFTGWYYRKGNYYGKIEMECGSEPEIEKEISEWMRPVVVEQFEMKTQTLFESHLTEGSLEKAKPLIRYAVCR